MPISQETRRTAGAGSPIACDAAVAVVAQETVRPTVLGDVSAHMTDYTPEID
jgi:hypothetical protein